MTRESPPPPPWAPPAFPIPFAPRRTQNVAPWNNHPSTHTSQLYLSPPEPPSIRKSSKSICPYSNVTAPPPAPPYEFARPPPVPLMSGSIPARPPFTAIGTNALGPPQRLMTIPAPNTAAPVPYHSGSSPNIVHPPAQSEMTGGPPPNTQGSSWSYLELHERDDVSSDSGDEDFAQCPDSMNNSSGYTGQKGPLATNPPYSGRRRRTKRRENGSASSSQAIPELEKCKFCPRLGPRHEWASLGHGEFCSERHKWEWELTLRK
ncbi:hypothetical protein F5888DRAFT_1672599 [Russula emetica]|nr:hypothetical protein F5888DRAFT_1672599 [Russula emetica]